MNIVVTFSQYAAVLTKFNSIIGRNFWGEAGVFGGEPSAADSGGKCTLKKLKKYS